MADEEETVALDIGPLLTRCDELLAAVQTDESLHGGLLTAGTVRASDELRIELSRLRKAMAK